MTGGGTATVAYTEEPSLLTAPESPTYYQPGTDVTIGELSLQNELARIRDPDSPEPVGSVAQNFEGAINLTWTLTDYNWHDIVFNDGGTAFKSGRPVPTRWWVGVDYIDGIAEREIQGAIVTQVQIQYQQGGKIEISLNLIYGDEEKNTEITPTSISKSEDTKMWHDADLSITGVTDVSCDKLQSATLQIDIGARFHRGGDRHPCDAVIGTVDSSLTTDAIFTEASDDRLAIAYSGSADATSPASNIDETSATFDVGSETYDLGGLKPNSNSWNSVIDPESDTQDSNEYHVSSVEVANAT